MRVPGSRTSQLSPSLGPSYPRLLRVAIFVTVSGGRERKCSDEVLKEVARGGGEQRAHKNIVGTSLEEALREVAKGCSQSRSFLWREDAKRFRNHNQMSAHHGSRTMTANVKNLGTQVRNLHR